MSVLAVLIPTVHRAEKLQPLLDNIAQATAVPHRTYFIAETDDPATKEALWSLTGEHMAVFGRFGSCARAMNAGVQASTEPYLFTGNDDLMFHPGWAEAALRELHPPTMAVGTNDGHGRMTCFAMVSRPVLQQHSGVFDQPGTLYHPGYASQYVDTEFADYAKHRGLWGEARESITEHLHHDFGKADPGHPNYVKAKATLDGDRATYERRRAAWESLPARS